MTLEALHSLIATQVFSDLGTISLTQVPDTARLVNVVNQGLIAFSFAIDGLHRACSASMTEVPCRSINPESTVLSQT